MSMLPTARQHRCTGRVMASARYRTNTADVVEVVKIVKVIVVAAKATAPMHGTGDGFREVLNNHRGRGRGGEDHGGDRRGRGGHNRERGGGRHGQAVDGGAKDTPDVKVDPDEKQESPEVPRRLLAAESDLLAGVGDNLGDESQALRPLSMLTICDWGTQSWAEDVRAANTQAAPMHGTGDGFREVLNNHRGRGRGGEDHGGDRRGRGGHNRERGGGGRGQEVDGGAKDTPDVKVDPDEKQESPQVPRRLPAGVGYNLVDTISKRIDYILIPTNKRRESQVPRPSSLARRLKSVFATYKWNGRRLRLRKHHAEEWHRFRKEVSQGWESGELGEEGEEFVEGAQGSQGTYHRFFV